MFFKKNKTETQEIAAYHGEASYRFFAPEFLDYERGPLWYAGAGAVSLAIVVFGLLTQGLTFVVAYLLFVAIYFLMHHQEARVIEVAILTHGVRVDGEFFAWKDVKEFWFVWKPPYVADLKIHIKRRLHPVVTIHLIDQDPAHLRPLLAPHAHEAKDRDETMIDLITRALRL